MRSKIITFSGLIFMVSNVTAFTIIPKESLIHPTLQKNTRKQQQHVKIIPFGFFLSRTDAAPISDEFEYWTQNYVSDGFINNKIEFRSSQEKGVGVFAKEKLRENELLFDFPSQNLISPNFILNHHEIGSKCKKLIKKFDNPDDATASILVSFVVTEYAKHEHSKFYHYLQSMPWDSTLVDCVLLWNNEEIQMLKGTSVFKDVISRRRQVDAEVTYIREVLPEFVERIFGQDLDAVIKSAFYMVNSRSFGFFLPDGENWSALMSPILDMFNHSPQPLARTVEYKVDWEKAEAVARRPVEAGEELTIAYGDFHTNADLFLYYGFVVKDDPSLWRATVELGIDKQDKLYDEKIALLEEYEFYPKGKQCVLMSKDLGEFVDLADDDFRLLRIMSIDTTEDLTNQGREILENAKSSIDDLRSEIELQPSTFDTDQDASNYEDDYSFFDGEQEMGLVTDNTEEDFDEENPNFYDLTDNEQKLFVSTLQKICSKQLSELGIEKCAQIKGQDIQTDNVHAQRLDLALALLETEANVLKTYL